MPPHETTSDTSEGFLPVGLRDLEDFHNGGCELRTPKHLVETVKANAVNSPLLRLPAEIRNKIYTYSFAPRNAKHIISIKPSTVGYTYEHRRGTEQSRPAFHLIRVCRQIYSEASLLCFEDSVFDLRMHHSEVPIWLAERNNAQRKAFTEIVVEVYIMRRASDTVRADVVDRFKEELGVWVPQLEWTWGTNTPSWPYAIVGRKNE